MLIQLKFFASIREGIGHGAEPVQTDARTVGALRDELIERGGAYADCLSRGRALRIALQQVMCDEAAILSEGAELAFFPPVTGG